jgi:hypothetical protein
MVRHTNPQDVMHQAERVFHLLDFLRTLGIEDQELIDFSIESETDFKEFMTSLVKADGEESAEITGRELYIKELKEGLDRKKKRRDRRRDLMRDAMVAAEQKSLSTDAGTVSLNPGRLSVVVSDEMQIHSNFWKPQPDKIDVEAIGIYLREREKKIEFVRNIEDEAARALALDEIDDVTPALCGATLELGAAFVKIKRS